MPFIGRAYSDASTFSDGPGPIRCSGGFCCTSLKKFANTRKANGRYAARRDRPQQRTRSAPARRAAYQTCQPSLACLIFFNFSKQKS